MKRNSSYLVAIMYALFWGYKNRNVLERKYKTLERSLKNPKSWNLYQKIWNLKQRVALAPEAKFRKRENKVNFRERVKMMRHNLTHEDFLFSEPYNLETLEWDLRKRELDVKRAAEYHARAAQEKAIKEAEGFKYEEKSRTSIEVKDMSANGYLDSTDAAVFKARVIDEYLNHTCDDGVYPCGRCLSDAKSL